MSLFAPDETKELSPRIPCGRGTSAAWIIAAKWFTPTDNIAAQDFGPSAASALGRWPDSHRVSNLHWYQENEARLGDYAGRWIAILQGAVQAQATTFAQVHEVLTERNINGALIVRVPDNPLSRPRLIA